MIPRKEKNKQIIFDRSLKEQKGILLLPQIGNLLFPYAKNTSQKTTTQLVHGLEDGDSQLMTNSMAPTDSYKAKPRLHDFNVTITELPTTLSFFI